jgi:1,4-alpha-glucan branching enzyme
MSLIKKYHEKKSVCKVTFELANDISKLAGQVFLAGDFNNWDIENLPMKKHKSGEFTISLDLEKGREYQFKYFVEGGTWLNDAEADKYVPNEFQGENSVVVV